MFGEHGLTPFNERLWRGNFLVASVVLSAAIYYGIEQPMERLRARLRRPMHAPVPERTQTSLGSALP